MHQKERVTLLLFTVITVAGFLLWVGGLIVVWLLLSLLRVSTDLWAMIEALSTAVAAAAVLSAGFIAYRELSEAASSRHMDIADRLFQELNSPENIAARRWVYQSLPDDPAQGIAALTPEGQAAVKQVLNSLDRVAFLTQTGWIPEEIIMPWMHPMIAKSWGKLKPYVYYERSRREEPYYYRYVANLGERCDKWQQKHGLAGEVTWVEKGL
jgi:hypothetical protein